MNPDTKLNKIKFQIARIMNSSKLALINDYEIIEEPIIEFTLIAEILMTEYEMFYAIIPFSYLSQKMINEIKNIIYCLATKLPLELASKIALYYIENSIPELNIPTNENTYIPEHIIKMNPHHLMNNYDLDINTDTEYTTEYIKKLVINNKFILGSRDHFAYDKIISIMETRDSDYITSYYNLKEEDERNSHEWRSFTSYLD